MESEKTGSERQEGVERRVEKRERIVGDGGRGLKKDKYSKIEGKIEIERELGGEREKEGGR